MAPRPIKMNSGYVIVENGEAHNVAYTSYAAAEAVLKAKYKEILDTELAECEGNVRLMCSDVGQVEENKMTGKTYLYIEKGIHIYIYKLPVLQ